MNLNYLWKSWYRVWCHISNVELIMHKSFAFSVHFHLMVQINDYSLVAFFSCIFLLDENLLCQLFVEKTENEGVCLYYLLFFLCLRWVFTLIFIFRWNIQMTNCDGRESSSFLCWRVRILSLFLLLCTSP